MLNIKRKPESIFAYEFADFEKAGYEAQPSIAAPIAV
jgi:thymidylate synthase